MYFSKSKYTAFRDCPKCCWLDKYRPEVKEINASVKARFEKGHEVGDLAKGLFGEYIETSSYRADGSLNIAAMLEKTKQLLAEGVENICEAAFDYNGLYCAVDILHKENGGYAIYEVKSSSSVKDYHCADVAYQKYVLDKCGVKITSVHVVVLNKEYIRQGSLDIKQLFLIDGGKDISEHITEEYNLVESNLKRAEKIINSSTEPDIGIGRQCGAWCGYWAYCSRHLPTPSVFDLYRFNNKWNCYYNNIITFDEVLKNQEKLTDMQRRQIEYSLYDKGIYADKQKIKEFLNSLSYPLYFLDFETMATPIPEFDGTHPNQQIPFQYSLHYVESETGEAQHREFLAESGIDPRRALAESLCNHIPKDICTLAFNSSVEYGIVTKLADSFPDLREHLLNIAAGIKDLLPIFRKNYYKKEIGSSFSIKSILPAICPDLDYHNLERVQNGTDASEIFPKIKDMSPEEAREARTQLLIYCKMDTLATVVLWQELLRVSK